MGRKKFIDKKKAATFSLVYRDSAAQDDATVPIRQFTRVDGGDSYVAGFSEDDPRSQTVCEYEEDDVVVICEEDSKFDDADEDGEDEEGDAEKVVQPLHRNRMSNAVAKEATVGRLPDNVRRELVELGFPDDGYDYNQHLRRIGSTGIGGAFVPSARGADLLPADIKAYDASNVDVQAVDVGREVSADNHIELVSSRTRLIRKPLSKAGVLDAEIIAALENSDGSQFDSADELDDEFVIFANEGVEERGHATPSRRSQDGGSTGKRGVEDEPNDGEYFSGEDDDEVWRLSGRPQLGRPARLLDEQFETLALHEYDDCDIGELEENNLARGRADISQFSSVLSEFLNDKDIYSEKYETVADLGKNSPACEVNRNYRDIERLGGKAANTNMVVNEDVDDSIVKKTLELGGYESEGEVVVLVESDDDGDEWDCVTVVSTYSNLDNHPAKISAPGRSKLRPKLEDLEMAKIIRLSGKQHLPVDYLPGKLIEVKHSGKPVDKESMSSGKVAGPRAGETPEEKKARKASIKEHRRVARLAKKTLKTCFREESSRAQHGAATMGPKVIHLS